MRQVPSTGRCLKMRKTSLALLSTMLALIVFGAAMVPARATVTSESIRGNTTGGGTGGTGSLKFAVSLVISGCCTIVATSGSFSGTINSVSISGTININSFGQCGPSLGPTMVGSVSSGSFAGQHVETSSSCVTGPSVTVQIEIGPVATPIYFGSGPGTSEVR